MKDIIDRQPETIDTAARQQTPGLLPQMAGWGSVAVISWRLFRVCEVLGLSIAETVAVYIAAAAICTVVLARYLYNAR